MAILYIDPEGGNDVNDGLSFANRVKTIASGLTAARIAPGDHVRMIGSPPKTDTGVNATWTNLSSTITLGSALNALITDCETAWTAAANVTATAAAQRRMGSFGAQLAIAAGFTTGKVAHFDLGSNQDYSAYQGITFWFRTTANYANGVFELRLCSDTAGDVAVDTFAIETNETMITGYWPIYVDKGSALGSAIRSISIWALSDPGTVTIHIDNISTVKAKGSSQTDNLNLTSMISPGPDGPWWAIRGISGTTVTLEWYPGSEAGVQTNGWAGTTGSYDLYKWEVVRVRQIVGAFGQNDAVQDSGAAGVPITMSGGWNRSDMSAQDSETWLDGKWGWTDAIYNGTTRSYWTFEKINLVRWYYGYRTFIQSGFKIAVGGTVRFAALQQASINHTSHADGEVGDIQDTGGGNNCIIISGSIRLTVGNITHIGGGSTGAGGIVSAGSNEPVMTKIGNCDIRTCKNYAFDLGSAGGIYRIKIGNITARNLGGGLFFNGFGGSAIKMYDIEIGDIDCDTFGTGTIGWLFQNHQAFRLRMGTCNIRNGAGTAWGFQGYPQAETFIKAMITSGNGGAGWGNNNGFNFSCGRNRIKATSFTDSTPRGNDTGIVGNLRTNGYVAFHDYQGVADAHRIEYSGFSIGTALITSETGANRHTLSGLGWKFAVLNATVPSSLFPVRHVLGKIYVRANALVTLRIWVNRSDTAINARLCMPGRDIAGVTNDVTDTAVASASTWEELEITFTPTEAGWIYPELHGWGGSTHHFFFDDFTKVQA